MTVQGPNGRKQIPLREFLRGMYATALEADELLVSVDVPCLPSQFGSAYLRIHRLQRPTLTVAAAASRRNGAIDDVRLAVGCVGPMALRLTELEVKVRGSHPSDGGKIIREAKSYLKNKLEPIDDLLGSAEYKVYIAGVLLERALLQALQNSEQKQDGKNG
jgi:carbon-monoxide dehydrogenase medium subunit